MTWLAAMMNCRQNGAFLVDINSAEENVFVNGFLNPMLWIGYNDRAVEGTFVWSRTGMAASFTDWGAIEPNLMTEENCVDIKNHTDGVAFWRDNSCEVEQPSMCKAGE